MIVIYKLRSRENTAIMEIKESDWKDALLKHWRIEAATLSPETDSEAAKMALQSQVLLEAPGDYLSPTLTIGPGETKKEASAKIARWRQGNKHFGKVNYSTAWKYY